MRVNGVELFVRDWPAEPRRATALLVHGFGEHSGRYGHVAAALNAAGVSVRAYDQRGFGRSGGARATLPTRDARLDDVTAVYDALAAETRGAGEPPPFLIGHSMGGLVAARAVTGGRITPRGLVLSSPALATRLGAVAQMAVRLGARVMPNFQLPHGLPLDKLSHDPRVVTAVRADPLSTAKATPRVAAFMIEAGRATLRDAGRLRVPTLLLAAGDDRLVDARAIRAFAAVAPPHLVTLHWYDGLYHELFNEREPERTQVLDALSAWVSATMASDAS